MSKRKIDEITNPNLEESNQRQCIIDHSKKNLIYPKEVYPDVKTLSPLKEELHKLYAVKAIKLSLQPSQYSAHNFLNNLWPEEYQKESPGYAAKCYFTLEEAINLLLSQPEAKFPEAKSTLISLLDPTKIEKIATDSPDFFTSFLKTLGTSYIAHENPQEFTEIKLSGEEEI